MDFLKNLGRRLIFIVAVVSILGHVWSWADRSYYGTVSMKPVGLIEMRLADGGRVTTDAYEVGGRYVSCSEVMHESGGPEIRLTSMGRLNESSPEVRIIPYGIRYQK